MLFRSHTVITVTSNGKSENVTSTQKGGNGEEPDPDPNPSGYAGRIEIPKLKGGDMNIFHTWTTKVNGKETVTYSYEYDLLAQSYDKLFSDMSYGKNVPAIKYRP